MKRTLIILLAAIFPVLSSSVTADEIAWDGIVSVDTVKVAPGDRFGVKIRLSNSDLAISGLEIPLRYVSSFLVLDSVSFVGSFKPENFNGLVYSDSENQTVKITYIPADFVDPLPAITAPAGVIAELFFAVSAEATEQVIRLDSINHDTLVGDDIHWWTRVQASDNAGQHTYLPIYRPGAIIVDIASAVGDDDGNLVLPSEFDLAQNYPNPFNPATVIEFSLPRASRVKLEVFNVVGQHVATLADGSYGAGVHETRFDASGQPSGIYFYRLSYNGGSQTEKMVLLK